MMTTTDPTGTLFRVLSPPDLIHYIFGHFGISNVLGLPVITHGGNVVAILDPRCLIETANERETIYTPPRGDLRWLA
jgi:hypothetical protein